MTALNFFFFGASHVVAQIIKTEFVVCAVGDVGHVVDALLCCRSAHARNHESNFESKPAMNTTHPLRVALRKIIVGSHQVHTFARQRIEIHRQR